MTTSRLFGGVRPPRVEVTAGSRPWKNLMPTCDLCGLPTSGVLPHPGRPSPLRARTRNDWDAGHVRAVHQLPLGGVGRWSCSRCGHDFEVSESWAVDHQTSLDSLVRTFVVCPTCAAEVGRLRPGGDNVHVDGQHQEGRDLEERDLGELLGSFADTGIVDLS